MAKFLVSMCLCMCLQTVLCQFGLLMPRETPNRPLFGLFDGAKRISGGIKELFTPKTTKPAPVVYQAFPNTPFMQNPYQNPDGIVIFPDMPLYNNLGNVNFGPNQGNKLPYEGANQDQAVTSGNQGTGHYGDQSSQGAGVNQGQMMGNEVNGVTFQNGNNQFQPNQAAPPENNPVNFEKKPSVTTTSAPTTVPLTTRPFSTASPGASSPAATRLPPLTPTPELESKSGNSVMFAPTGVFMGTCNTVDGRVGSCINVFQCQPYAALLRESKINQAAVETLRKAHCGFDGSNPKVCCPLPEIPSAPLPPQPLPTTTTTTTTTVASVTASAKSVSNNLVPDLPEPPSCGVSNASLSRVVGGIDAHLGDFPWIAVLGYNSPRTGGTKWACGGSLISSKHVLTAAHCVHNHENDLYVVRLGELDLSKDDDGAAPIDILIKEKIKHENYDARAYTNDIAILVLEKEVQFTDMIKPICIPKESELRAKSFEDYNPLIAGWGQTNFRGPSASHLQVVQLPVLSNEFCAQRYSQYKAQVIDERSLCAGYKTGGKDACKGDSGGPLMQPIWSKQTLKTYFYQIGVVSFGKGCAEAGFPGVYTRVTQFVPWIMRTVVGRDSR